MIISFLCFWVYSSIKFQDIFIEYSGFIFMKSCLYISKRNMKDFYESLNKNNSIKCLLMLVALFNTD